MISFLRDKKTGIVKAYKNKEYIGQMDTMGDNIAKSIDFKQDGEKQNDTETKYNNSV